MDSSHCTTGIFSRMTRRWGHQWCIIPSRFPVTGLSIKCYGTGKTGACWYLCKNTLCSLCFQKGTPFILNMCLYTYLHVWCLCIYCVYTKFITHWTSEIVPQTVNKHAKNLGCTAPSSIILETAGLKACRDITLTTKKPLAWWRTIPSLKLT